MNADVIRLYEEICSKAPHEPISSLLPLALVFAKKAKNIELEKWVKLEMEGYYNSNSALTDDVVVPVYRTVGGRHYDALDRPLILQDSRLGFVNEYRLRYSVAELEEMAGQSGLLTVQDIGMISGIREHLKVEVDRFSFSPSSVLGVLTAIRSKLLDWLEEFEVNELPSQHDKNPQMKPETLILEGLHPLVIEVAGNLYRDGYYRQAILDTYILIVEQVKLKSGKYDLDGTRLMQAVFSKDNPILKISDDSDEQLGFMWMFCGAVMGIRNPKAHRLITQTDPQRTLEWLAFASVLLRILDTHAIKVDAS